MGTMEGMVNDLALDLLYRVYEFLDVIVILVV